MAYVVPYPVFMVHDGDSGADLLAAGVTHDGHDIVFAFTSDEAGREFCLARGKGQLVAVTSREKLQEVARQGRPRFVSFDPVIKDGKLFSKNHVEVAEILAPKDDPLPEGLVEFYSSQADVLLAQYRNINQLLGSTNDWTHPGTHCELLIRDFLRRNLPSRFSVDKGYIFGRAPRHDGVHHCPEIDVLVHNSSDFRPVFRLEDFVIVQPDAVVGIIQIKRALDVTKLRAGVNNVVWANRHYLEMIRSRRGDHPSDFMRQIFSAVIGFECRVGDFGATANLELSQSFDEQKRVFGHLDRRLPFTSMCLPNFVGSLTKCFAMTQPHGYPLDGQDYLIFPSTSSGRNIALQAMLYSLTEIVSSFGQPSPPFAFPNDLAPIGHIHVRLKAD